MAFESVSFRLGELLEQKGEGDKHTEGADDDVSDGEELVFGAEEVRLGKHEEFLTPKLADVIL